jgi:hypothetical protein
VNDASVIKRSEVVCILSVRADAQDGSVHSRPMQFLQCLRHSTDTSRSTAHELQSVLANLYSTQHMMSAVL